MSSHCLFFLQKNVEKITSVNLLKGVFQLLIFLFTNIFLQNYKIQLNASSRISFLCNFFYCVIANNISFRCCYFVFSIEVAQFVTWNLNAIRIPQKENKAKIKNLSDFQFKN